MSLFKHNTKLYKAVFHVSLDLQRSTSKGGLLPPGQVAHLTWNFAIAQNTDTSRACPSGRKYANFEVSPSMWPQVNCVGENRRQISAAFRVCKAPTAPNKNKYCWWSVGIHPVNKRTVFWSKNYPRYISKSWLGFWSMRVRSRAPSRDQTATSFNSQPGFADVVQQFVETGAPECVAPETFLLTKCCSLDNGVDKGQIKGQVRSSTGQQYTTTQWYTFVVLITPSKNYISL
jgi:hypothetical protein